MNRLLPAAFTLFALCLVHLTVSVQADAFFMGSWILENLFDTKDDPQYHHVDADTTRDIVEAKLRRNGSDRYVFMDHWPSRFHEESYRNKAADVLRRRVDALLSTDPKTDIIMVGDFNDEPDDGA